MKTFKDLKIGDSLYFLDGEFDIIPVRIDGIRNVSLSDTTVEIFTVGRKEPIKADACQMRCTVDKDRFGRPYPVTCFSCLQVAKKEQVKIRDCYVDKQFQLAKQVFNRIKKVAPNDERLKIRIFNFFNIKE